MRGGTPNLLRSALVLGAALVLDAASWGAAAQARQPTDLAGAWDLSLDRTGTRCRVILRPERSDKGDYFLGMRAACRHAMPEMAAVGRWALPDDAHLALQDPAGKPILTLTAVDRGFAASSAEGTYALTPVGEPGRSGAALTEADDVETAAAGFRAVAPPQGPGSAAIVPVAKRAAPEVAAVHESAADLAGRYAVMREKRDTGCMLTLDDKTRGKVGGNRAQLAPGCRDQGIVIFDPAGWALVKGELVLTAKAGHKAKLERKGEGAWARDTADGGKPLGLKKL